MASSCQLHIREKEKYDPAFNKPDRHLAFQLHRHLFIYLCVHVFMGAGSYTLKFDWKNYVFPSGFLLFYSLNVLI